MAQGEACGHSSQPQTPSLPWLYEFCWLWADVYLAVDKREVDPQVPGAPGYSRDSGCRFPGVFLGLESPSTSPSSAVTALRLLVLLLLFRLVHLPEIKIGENSL